MPGKRLQASAHPSPGRRSGPQAATELFHALVEHSSDAVALLDETGAITYVSQAATRLLGYGVPELTGTNAFGFLHPDDLDLTQRLCQQLLDQPGTPIRTELRARHKDGSYHLVEAVAVNRLDDPAVGAVVANWRDITERLRAEQALRNSEQSYRSLVDGVRDVIFALSPGGEVTSLNPAFEEMTGFPPAEWVGRPFEAFVHPDDVPLALDLFGRVLQGEPRPTIQFRILTRAGTYRVAEFSATAQLRDGRLTGILGIGRDVTERLGLEQQLRQAQKMEAVGRLAGGIAHDFNNILTAITGHADLLLEDLGHHDPRRADVDEIRRSAERAAGLTRQLLAFSRQQVLQPKVVDLNALVLDMDKLLRRLIGEDVELATVLDPTLGRVTADPGVRDRAARRGRAGGARDRAAGARAARVHGARGTERRRCPGARRPARRHDPPAAHRRRDAGDERPGSGRPADRAAARHPGAVHLGLHRQRHRASRDARARPRLFAEAIPPRCPGAHSARGAGRGLTRRAGSAEGSRCTTSRTR